MSRFSDGSFLPIIILGSSNFYNTFGSRALITTSIGSDGDPLEFKDTTFDSSLFMGASVVKHRNKFKCCLDKFK